MTRRYPFWLLNLSSLTATQTALRKRHLTLHLGGSGSGRGETDTMTWKWVLGLGPVNTTCILAKRRPGEMAKACPWRVKRTHVTGQVLKTGEPLETPRYRGILRAPVRDCIGVYNIEKYSFRNCTQHGKGTLLICGKANAAD